MNQHSSQLRRTIGLLLAAAALPSAPLLAQEAATQAPAAGQPAQPAPDDPPEADTPTAEPVTVTPAPAPAEPVAEPADEPVARAAPAAPRRTTTTSTTTRTVRAPAPAAPALAPPPAAAPFDAAPGADAAAVAPLPPGEDAGSFPVEELPAPAATGPVDTVAPVQPEAERDPSSIVLWVLGAIVAGALAYFLLRRRRRDDIAVHHTHHEAPAAPVREPVRAEPVNETVHHEPVRAPIRAPIRPAPVAETPRPAPAAAPPAAVPSGVGAPLVTAAAIGGTVPAFRSFPATEPAAPAPAAPAPAAAIPAAVPAAAAPAAAALPLDAGEPRLDLLMHPVRAGVTGDEARVEFALAVENQGSAPARHVRISTWLLAAGGDRGSDMERMLIERGAADAAELPEVTIEAGAGQRIETSASLPTAGLRDDAVLPVVVAEARYRLPDGSEGRTSARFAVGVPDGEELAHFAIANPSGLHEGVVARELGEPERT